MIIHAEAKNFFDKVNAIDPDLNVIAASAWWFEHFEEHHGVFNLKLTGKSCKSTELQPSATVGELAQPDGVIMLLCLYLL
jgi:hypothetical protein